MPENVVDDGAVLVHPSKAFILRHLPTPERYQSDEEWTHGRTYYSNTSSSKLEHGPDEVQEYVGRLQESVATLFGPMDFDLHLTRTYSEQGLGFHPDHDNDYGVPEGLIRMATCIHNATDEDRALHFRRPDWSGHTEEFSLPIPARRILVFGGQLITHYTHGIPPSAEATTYRSIVTRFSLWRDLDPDDLDR